VADNNQKYSYNLFYYGKKLGKIELSVPGYHNVSNSLCAAAVALGYGINFATIAKGLKEYKPSLRRFEEVKNPFGYTVIHDYAHHPTELLATITTAKKLCKGKLIAVFEPHTYSRTQSLWKEFVDAFRQVDYAILPPIYPAREAPIKGITSEKLSLAIAKSGVKSDYANSLEEAYKKIKIITHKNDMVLLLGAGTIQKFALLFCKNILKFDNL
jgi:UDP-N-acetylmuramate--alanine ligase